jgi:hypothetical protein
MTATRSHVALSGATRHSAGGAAAHELLATCEALVEA